MPGEDAMEYWIRLNKTVDVANDCLKRQGRSIDDLGHEVSMIFIKHCPDLSQVFSSSSRQRNGWPVKSKSGFMSTCRVRRLELQLLSHLSQAQQCIKFIPSVRCL